MPWRKPSDQYKAKFGHKLVEGEYYDEKTSAFDQSYGALVSELMLQQTQYVACKTYSIFNNCSNHRALESQQFARILKSG